MSVATIDDTIDETSVEGGPRDASDITAWLDCRASLRRAFTAGYRPRHRADGPAA